MNFYISDSVDNIKINDYNVEVSDELVDFIYSLKKIIPFKRNILYSIDPYSDVEISLKDIPEIIDICNYLLDSSLLDFYSEDGVKETLRDLSELSVLAIREGKNIISIGD